MGQDWLVRLAIICLFQQLLYYVNAFRFKNFGEDSSTWESANLVDLGSIAASLDASEMTALTIDVDVVESWGAFDIYSTDQVDFPNSQLLTR